MYLTKTEIAKLIESQPDPALLKDAFELRLFWYYAVYPREYEPDPRWSEYVSFEGWAKERLDSTKVDLQEAPEHVKAMAAFLLFFSEDILLDCSKSDLAGIEALLAQEIVAGKIKLPYRFGRLLYDKFYESPAAKPLDRLEADVADDLLKDTPIGFCQISHRTTGPLGLVLSREKRFFPPRPELPLWHCSDTGCQKFHNVAFGKHDSTLQKASLALKIVFSNQRVYRDDFRHMLNVSVLRPDYPTPKRYFDLPSLLGDAILGGERTALLEAALRGQSADFLRTHIRQRIGKDYLNGSPGDIAARIAPEVQLHLLLLLEDSEIAGWIDKLSDEKKIMIPLGHQRKSRMPLLRMNDVVGCDLSTYGLRSTDDPAPNKLVDLIMSGYSGNNMKNELSWQLGGREPSPATIMEFVRAQGPLDAVEKLILTSESVTRDICGRIDLNFERVRAKDSRAVNILMWKMGFDPPQYDSFPANLIEQLDSFEKALYGVPSIGSEAQRAEIRSAGVNVFVLLEDFLDRLVSYNVWLLASDHFVDTHHHFSLHLARDCVARELGSSIESNGMTLTWDSKGGNSLGVLLGYCRESTNWLMSLLERDREVVKRDFSDLPHYADEDRCFIFRHRALWADCDHNGLQAYASDFESIVKSVEQSNAACLRNGLDHFRDASSFPSLEALIAGAGRLKRAVIQAARQRLVPVVYWVDNYSQTRYDIAAFRLVNESGGSHTINYPPRYRMPRFDLNSPLLIAAGNLLGGPNSDLVFSFYTDGQFEEFWRGFPRRLRDPIIQSTDPAGQSAL